uniref:Uncharacterized protein n=1 Tax=Pipistrellus kuhlii TaxID=59472 RepID=A0A7J7XV85_PIPKU|nr:hypothetical protein mPipKuh1_010510 [Pipistrellus kuhlii]
MEGLQDDLKGQAWAQGHQLGRGAPGNGSSSLDRPGSTLNEEGRPQPALPRVRVAHNRPSLSTLSGGPGGSDREEVGSCSASTGMERRAARPGRPSETIGEDATWHCHLNSKHPVSPAARHSSVVAPSLGSRTGDRFPDGGHDWEASGMRSCCSFWSTGREDLASLAPGEAGLYGTCSAEDFQ